ncbi:MAG: lycopene cyclase family protein [Flavobacteriaceae bacterium]
MAQYDFIILGAGAAGLMLARAMAEDRWFESSRILIIEKELKDQNDRTWCYWEESSGPYDKILNQRWNHILFKGKRLNRKLDIQPFNYKLIRSKDFYEAQFEFLQQVPNIEFLQASVLKVDEKEEEVSVQTSVKTVVGDRIFSSLFDYNSLLSQNDYPVLQQHFVGWFVETEKAIFDDKAPTFMDFSIPQQGNTRFMYILPFSPTQALVEYTLFSSKPLEIREYEEAIESYMSKNYGNTSYRILEKEQGNIPMTCFDFESRNTERLLHIGTAGGWAKPSTGYTFKNSMKNSRKVVDHLKKGRSFRKFSVKSRYWYYDLLLLDILDNNNHLGSVIFEAMFRNRSPRLILKFLDENCSWYQDLWIITGCPVLPFTKALWARLFK